MIGKGRRKILSDYSTQDTTDINVIINILDTAFQIHFDNSWDIQYLIDYKNGRQDILDKMKEVRPEINNKLVVNHAQMVTRLITGYFLGTPIQYIQAGAEKKDEIELLNRYLNYQDKHSVDCEIGEYQSICGTAYRIIYTDGAYGNEVPFEDKCLSPLNTFVVYENNVAQKPLLGVYFHDIYDGVTPVGKKIYAYSSFGVYTFQIDSDKQNLDESSFIGFSEYNVGGIPIIEYPNNMWRLGDWELLVGLMEAINKLQSGRLDDIDQIVQSLLVFINADIDEEVYTNMRQEGVVMLKNTTGNPSSIDVIENKLDQSGMNIYANELEELLYALLGIPDRNNRKGGGGDTGQAVELRDGWTDLEIVARNKEASFKKSEKQTLRIMLNILSNKENIELSLLDVDVKFSRNKNSNLLVKTQGYMNLITTKTLAPSDCLTIVDLVSDVNDYIERGKSFWGDDFAQIRNEIKSENSSSNENEPMIEDEN